MILPATYQNGFAPRDGQPLYPSLWKGCVGAWNPGLGPSGLVLRDNSGFGNHGTLTNGPTWVANQGQYAINFDGVNDDVQCGVIDLVGDKTWSAWIYPTSTARGGILGNYTSSFPLTGATLVSQRSSPGNLTFFVPTGGLLQVAGGITTNAWQHVAVTHSGQNVNLYRNGSLVGATAAFGSVETSSALFRIANESNLGDWFAGSISSVQIYKTILSFRAIQLLATRRGIAYEMAPRRRSTVQVTTNRRRRIIIGGNR